MISVDDARARLVAAVRPLPAEIVDLKQAHGRVLAATLRAGTDQPPFPASAMDGYALRAEDGADALATLEVIGEAAAGRPFDGRVGPGQAVRIFTGAIVPSGADAVVMQEDAGRDGGQVTLTVPLKSGQFVRQQGLDFRAGEPLLDAGTLLRPAALALCAAMGHATLPVTRKPRVGVLATGDELVRPGTALAPGQIVNSNTYGLIALLERWGAAPLDLGIAADTRASLEAAAERATGCDLLITLGGASVGDHDLVQEVLGQGGIDFYKVAMRPGKPLMFGSTGSVPLLGLPGNPVSSLVTAILFALPLLATLQGRADDPLAKAFDVLPLAGDMPANDQRQDYRRAQIVAAPDGTLSVRPFKVQDSSMLRVFATSDALIERPPHAPAACTGEPVRVVRLDLI